MKQSLRTILISLGCLVCGACTTTIPSTRYLGRRYPAQAAQFRNALGPLSARRSAALVARLQGKSGPMDILDRQIALEQAVVGRPLSVGNKVRLLQDGPATYAAMFAAIQKATDNVNVESYIIEDGDVGRRFADALIQCRARGVQVSLIYDSVGVIGTPKAYFDRLRSAGVRMLEFNPINPLATARPWRLNHRDHRKLLVVDGRTAFLGGINIATAYSSGSSLGREAASAGRKPGWRDTDIQIEGPAVSEFQKLFLETWAKQRGDPMPARQYYPAVKPMGKDIVRAIGSTPDEPYSMIYLTLLSAIMNAEKRIYIANAYFVPDPQLCQALIDAAKRGVDVRLLLPRHSDSALVFYAGRSFYDVLLQAGVKIYERRGPPMHEKTAVVDGLWSCVGSSNLDWRSALDNDEINAIMLGREFAAQMQAAYAKDIANSNAIDPVKWRRRSPWLRLKESGARLCGRLL